MRYFVGVFGLVVLASCTTSVSQSNHQNLNVKECREMAQETFRSGKLNHNLCPGYMPNGQKIELF
jgi:hypothetical protein